MRNSFMVGGFENQFIDARTDRGLSIEQVAESTKIRVDYLIAIENGNYDQNLPSVYMRGFIKSYAKFLRLDIEDVMKNCPIRTSETDIKSSKRFSFNTIVANEKEQDEAVNGGINDSVPFSRKMQWAIEKLKVLVRNRKFLKISGAVIGGILLILVFGKIFTRSDRARLDLNKQAEKVLSSTNHSSIELISAGDIKVVVRDKKSGDKIFAENMEAGQVKKIQFSSPVQIFHDKGEFLMLKRDNGEHVYPQPGRGGLEIK